MLFKRRDEKNVAFFGIFTVCISNQFLLHILIFLKCCTAKLLCTEITFFLRELMLILAKGFLHKFELHLHWN